MREVTSQNTLVTVVNSQGEPITNAKLNYACVNGSKEIQGEADEATYNSTLEGYQLKSTDPHQYALFIEVEAPGYQTVLTTMYLWNYNYYLHILMRDIGLNDDIRLEERRGGELVVENKYFGANMAPVYNGKVSEVICGEDFVYRNVYAGSRLATIYGNIVLTIRGGSIGNLYGGSEGSDYISADVRKWPAS